MNNVYDAIEEYLNGELTGPDLQTFEQALRDDPALREAVERHRAVIDQLRGMRLRQTVKKNIQPPPRFSLSPRLLAVAAVFLLLLAALVFWMPRKKDQPALAPLPPAEQPRPDEKPPVAEQPVPKPATPRPRTHPAIAETLRDMRAPDYTVMGEAQKDAALEKQLDKALTLLKAEQPARAVPLLDAVLASGNALYREDAEWLLALAWLQQAPGKGKTLLDAIAQNPAHAWRLEALRLSGKMN